MRRAVAIALLGLGIGFAGSAPASAGGKSAHDEALPLHPAPVEVLTPADSSRCWWDVPVIGAGVAFFELLRDEEVDYHCTEYGLGQPDDGTGHSSHW
jgi:hypothetical protein